MIWAQIALLAVQVALLVLTRREARRAAEAADRADAAAARAFAHQAAAERSRYLARKVGR